MPEHHLNDAAYFGEDYYDSDGGESDYSEIRDDPYAEAERLHKLHEKNPITKHPEFIDEQNIIIDHHHHNLRDESF